MMFPMLFVGSPPVPEPPTMEYRVKTLTGGTFGNDGWTTSGGFAEGWGMDGRSCLMTGYGTGPIAISEKVYESNLTDAEIRLIGMRTNAECEWRASIRSYPTDLKSVEIRVTGAAGWYHFTIQTFVDSVLVHSHDEPCGLIDWLGSASIVKTGNSYAIKVNGATVHSFTKSDPMNHYRCYLSGHRDFRLFLDDLGYLAPL